MPTEEKIVKIVDATIHSRGASVEQVGDQGALITKVVGTPEVSISGDMSVVSDSKYVTNHLDDYTTTGVTYVGQEDASGVWKIIKIDESGNFPVFTFAGITNNAALTDYATAWAARTTATYGAYSGVF